MPSFQQTAGSAAVVPDGTVEYGLFGFVEPAGMKPESGLAGTKTGVGLAGTTCQVDLVGKKLEVGFVGSYGVVEAGNSAVEADSSVVELEAAAGKMVEKLVVAGIAAEAGVADRIEGVQAGADIIVEVLVGMTAVEVVDRRSRIVDWKSRHTKKRQLKIHRMLVVAVLEAKLNR